MVIACPACQARYRINPATGRGGQAKVKCPECKHVFEVTLFDEAGDRPCPPGDAKPVVLVVDDARFFRDAIEDILNSLPIKLVSAADGHEAWQKIEALRPQLILLDLNIPGKSGKEILQDLRKDARFDRIKVLVISGVERGEETSVTLRLLGADDFIIKSFKPSELQSRVSKLLGI
jgi:predicted Zn finger-like uncharacterized protein